MTHKATPLEAADQPGKESAKGGLEQQTLRRSDASNRRTSNGVRASEGESVRQEAATKKTSGDKSIFIRRDLTPDDVNKLTRRQLQDVQSATRDGLSNPKRLTKRRLSAYERKFQGELAENALAKMGGLSLNDAKGNFPVYDHLFKCETASVKTHLPNPEHANQHLAAYAHDLRVAIGATDAKRGKYAGRDGPSFAADQFKGFASAEADFSHANKTEIHRYLIDTATLRIPSNHVEAVQDYVHRCAAQDPELYGLPKHYQDNEMDRLVDRIKPIPLTETQIRQAVQTRMAELQSK